MTPELAQALTRYSREEVEADHIIIDSLTKCGIGVDDYNKQKEFVDWLASYARDSGIHVHLVCHSRKKDNDTSPMNKFDVRGAGEITDLADNVCIVWQNQTPEHKRDEGDPDGMLIVDKQRHSRLKGRILLWYDEAWQFHPHEQHKRQDILHLWT